MVLPDEGALLPDGGAYLGPKELRKPMASFVGQIRKLLGLAGARDYAVNFATSLRARYAVSGTDSAYGTTASTLASVRLRTLKAA
eukprot:3012995-Rhodomonas_salina.1